MHNKMAAAPARVERVQNLRRSNATRPPRPAKGRGSYVRRVKHQKGGRP